LVVPGFTEPADAVVVGGADPVPEVAVAVVVLRVVDVFVLVEAVSVSVSVVVDVTVVVVVVVVVVICVVGADVSVRGRVELEEDDPVVVMRVLSIDVLAAVEGCCVVGPRLQPQPSLRVPTLTRTRACPAGHVQPSGACHALR